MQHSLASWLIEYGDLAAAEKNDPGSERLNHLMNDWVESVPQEDRAVFFNELFDALGADGTETLDEIDLDRLQSILLKLTGVSATTRKTFAKLPNKLLFDDAIQPLPQTKAEKLKAFFSDLRILGVVYLLAGVILFLMSGFLFELTTIVVVAALAVVQLILTIRRLIRQKGMFGETRGRFFVLIAVLALAAIVIFKEQAMFLIGSGLYGILCIALSYYAFWIGTRQKEEPFLRVLNYVEGGAAGLYGLGFLLIPQSAVRPFAISLGACVAFDGLVRLGYWFVRHLIRRRRQSV